MGYDIAMHYVKVKGIVSPKGGMNLYRGCQHGCIYFWLKYQKLDMYYCLHPFQIKGKKE